MSLLVHLSLVTKYKTWNHLKHFSHKFVNIMYIIIYYMYIIYYELYYLFEEEYSYCKIHFAHPNTDQSQMKFTLYIPILQKLADRQKLWALQWHLLNTAPQSTIFPQR